MRRGLVSSAIAVLTACSGEAVSSTPPGSFPGESAAAPSKAGLGKVLTSTDGAGGKGQSKPSISRRPQGQKIVKPLNGNSNDDFVTFGIVGDDVGFVSRGAGRTQLENPDMTAFFS